MNRAVRNDGVEEMPGLRRLPSIVVVASLFLSMIFVQPARGEPSFQLSGGPIVIYTNDLSGSVAVDVWSDVWLTGMSVETYFLNETYYPDEEIYEYLYQGGSFIDYLANATYNRTVSIASSPELRIWTVGGAGVQDIDLGLFLDGMNGNPLDGMAQAGEFVEYSALAYASELIDLIEPEDGTYIITVAGYSVSGNPGYFDLSISVAEPGAYWLTVSSVPIGFVPAFTVASFNLHWDFPGATADDWYFAGLYLGYASNPNVTYVQVSLKLDRSPPWIGEVTPETSPLREELRSIYCSFYDSDGELSRDSVRLFLDGVNVTSVTEVDIPFDDVFNEYGYYSGHAIYWPLGSTPLGRHSIVVEIEDYAGNIARRERFFMLEDETSPVLDHTAEIMSSEGYTVPITALVQENLTLGNVSLMYKQEGDAFYSALSMSSVDGSNTYVATMPAYEYPAVIQYHINATDTEGNYAVLPEVDPELNPFVIEIQPLGFPRISHRPVVVYAGGDIRISALVSDDEAVSSVNLFYRKSTEPTYNSLPMVGVGGHLYEAIIPGGAVSPFSVQYYVEASDGANVVSHPLDPLVPHFIMYNVSSPVVAEVPLKESHETISVAVMEDIEFNPKMASNSTSKRVIDLLYDSLGRRDPSTLEIVPWLAESWSVDEGSNLVSVDLRSDIFWHDDASVTADDVAYSFEIFHGGYDVTVVSPTSVVFDFSSGGGGKFMTTGLLLPLVRSGETDPQEGCGPFALVERDSNHTLIKTFLRYFADGPLLGGIDFIRFSDIDEAANAFINGTIDFIGWELEPEDLVEPRIGGKLLVDVAEAEVSYTSGLHYSYFGFNPNSTNSLDDINLRLAISELMNKEILPAFEIDSEITHSIMSSRNTPWFNASIRIFNAGYTVIDDWPGTNIYPGEEILYGSGYFDIDGDGWREKPDGSNLSLSLLGPSPTDDLYKATIALFLENILKSAGVNASADTDSSADPSDYDIYLGVGQMSLDPTDISSVEEIVSFADPELDALLQETDDAMNQTNRSAIVKEALGMISEKAPFVPILQYKAIEVYNGSRFGGWVRMPGGINNFRSFMEVYSLFDTVVDRPLGLYASVTQDSEIVLTWRANEESDLQSYLVYRSSVSGGPYDLVEELSLQTSFVDADLGSDDEYCYIITAKDTSGESLPSEEVCIDISHIYNPPLISDLRVDPFPQEIHLFVNISAVVVDLSGVEGTWIDIAGVGNHSMDYDSSTGRYHFNRTYSALGTFDFNITARDTFGNWAAVPGAFVIEDTTPPEILHSPVTVALMGDPIDVLAEVEDNLQIGIVRLNFTDVDGISHNETMVLSGDNYTHQIPAQASVGSMTYFLWAVDTEGNAAMNGIHTIEIVTETVSPAAPQNLTAETGERGTLLLNWTAPITSLDGSPLTDLVGYNIYRMTSSGGQRTLVNADPVDATTFLDTGLEEGKTYYYVVTAVDRRGNESPASNEAHGTTKSAEQGDWLWLLVPLLVLIVIIVIVWLLIRRRKGEVSEGTENEEG